MSIPPTRRTNRPALAPATVITWIRLAGVTEPATVVPRPSMLWSVSRPIRLMLATVAASST